MNLALAYASLNGTVVLLALTAAGGCLAWAKILHDDAVHSFAQVHVNVFLPSLLFTSILDAVYAARSVPSTANISKVAFPPVWGIFVPLVGLAAGWLCVQLVARRKAAAVRRVAMMSIAFGNAGNLPLMLLTALCDTFAPLGKEPQCVPQSASLTSLFGISWNVLLWLPMYSYVTAAPDRGEDDCGAMDESNDGASASSFKQLLSPPFMGILAGIVTAWLPYFPQALLHIDGALISITAALRQLGNAVIPTSSLIVGARLYSAYARKSDERTGSDSSESIPLLGANGKDEDERFTFGARLHAAIFVTRLAILPALGRLFFYVFNLRRLPSGLLGLVALIEFAVPTANSVVMVAILASRQWRNAGRQIEEEVATSVMYQYVGVPLLLTINTALALRTAYSLNYIFVHPRRARFSWQMQNAVMQ